MQKDISLYKKLIDSKDIGHEIANANNNLNHLIIN